MSRLGWLKRGASTANGLPAMFDETAAVQNAMQATVLVMNDEYDEAEAALSRQDTPFSKLGHGCVCFLRAVLGMQKEDIEKALKILADAEHTNAEFLKRAQANPASAHQSEIYPPGTEYALAHAESQLMYAVCAILNASYIESVKGLLKMRKAYATLHDIYETEKKYLKSIGKGPASIRAASLRPSSKSSSAIVPPAVPAKNGVTIDEEDDDDDEDDFQDAEEDLSGSPISQRYQGHVLVDSVSKLSLNDHANGYTASQNDHTAKLADMSKIDEDDFDFRTISNNTIDIFIHAGMGLAFGTLQLILSLVPPPFDKVLAMFSFKGDRKVGLDLLWSSCKFVDDINGALAGLINLVFHNGPIAFSQIAPKSALPIGRLQNLLMELRRLYPRSQIWQLEEAIMLSEARQLQPALKTFATARISPLKSIQALGKFELGLHYMYAHDYTNCSQAFMDLLPLSDWSYGLYYYIAAICQVELYRAAVLAGAGSKAEEYRTKAEGYFQEVNPNLGKKKVLGRGLPIEIFVKRKVDKYNARAASRKVNIVDAIGVSPVEDIIYFWGGYDCMPDSDLQVSIEKLAWSEKQSGWASETPDEKTVLSLLKGACLRVMGKFDLAREELVNGVTSQVPKQVQAASGKEADMWALPAAHYEVAVCYWRECGGEAGDKATLQLAANEIHKIAHWGSYELESIHGLKVSTAVETLRNLGCHV